jgi:hypothetical protein
MLRLDELELIQLFRQPGGKEFVVFCNRVIRATCWAHGIPQSEVSTTTRTDAKDGGVDTRVAQWIRKDRSGYFESPSIWQFKASDEANVTTPDMHREVTKPYARKCIENGDAYRLCICDSLTDEKKRALAEALEREIVAINKLAPTPRVLSINDITEIANFYPALVMQYRPGADSLCISFDRWSEIATRVTSNFIPPSTFEATKLAVLAHVDFSKDVLDPVVALHGQSGVGKTRSAFECFSGQPGASSFILYADDEDGVVGLSNMLVNDERVRVVVIADDCSLSTRANLSRKLAGCRDRVRCICIDNSTERAGGPAPEFTVRKPDSFELQKILEANFPHIPDDRLRAYARFSEGFVRIAADICANYDDKIQQAGDFSPIAGQLDDYYRDRLATDDAREAVEAISFLKRVKYRGQSPTELDHICRITGTDRAKLEKNLDSIKEAPGFVERGPLYYRVTPHLVALIAFESAWKRWAEKDPAKFLAKLPDEIQESFLERVAEGRNQEVRDTVRNFFRRFADSLTPANLVDVELVNKFVKLIETDPATYFPLLQRLVHSATREELTGAPDWALGSWGPRRQLVWLAERFAQFPEFFGPAEDVLYVLATSECEENISNNATRVWQQLFRMTLSGTAIPLSSRLDVLNSRLHAATDQTADLNAGALEEILSFHGSRIVGPPVVAGRLVPPEWNPSAQQVKDVVVSGLLFILRAFDVPLRSLAEKAKLVLLREVDSLVRRGWIDVVKPIVATSQLDENDRARLVSDLKGISAWGKHPEGVAHPEAYSRKIDDWIAELRPVSLHARLVEAVAAASWDHFGVENEWESALKALATELSGDEHLLESEIDWLTSADPKSAFELGHALGGLDPTGRLLGLIARRSEGREAGLARGYIAGLLYVAGGDPGPVNEILDSLQIKDPAFAFQLSLAGGQKVHVFDRAVELIRAGRLPVYVLRNFVYWVGSVATTNEQVAIALEAFLPNAREGDRNSADAIIDFIGMRLHSGRFNDLLSVRRDLVWDCLEAFTAHPGREAFWWGKALQAVASDDPRRAIRLACRALVGESFEVRDQASKLLGGWASTYPNDVMSEVGSLMLDPAGGIAFFLRKFPVFIALPLDVVTAWLETARLEGAQKIARHLPAPHLDAAGQPVVPELTAWVLTRFETDDRVFHEFCAGVHSYQMYGGDIAAAHESEAERARKFFDYPLRRIREWARSEYEGAKRLAEMQREMEDEMDR